MNIWTSRSFELHNNYGYLDNLYEIYPMLDNEVRTLDIGLKEEIKKAFDNKNNEELFKLLLLQKKFPIKDSYKPYFTRVPKNETDLIIKNNPKTVQRICNRIYAMGFDKMIEGLEEPIETNRQIGPMFPNWIRGKYNSYIDVEEFLKSQDYISVLHGTDDFLVYFVKEFLKVKLPVGSGGTAKGLDMVVKINTQPKNTFVIGEAKFLTDEGGHQNAQLKDALNLITSSDFGNEGNYNVIRLAILDGVCWINTKNTKMQNDIRGLNDDQIAISALLLDEFFYSL